MNSEEIVVIGTKKRPIGTKEAALLTAWKMVMDSHGWAESLMCIECFTAGTQTGIQCPDVFCHCATIPGKSITINCACTKREWTGVTK